MTAWIILGWFVSGVTLLQGWGNYPTWLDMGPMMSNEDFMRLREAHYWIIYPLAIFPGMIALALNVALVMLRPQGVSLWLLIAALILGVVIAIPPLRFKSRCRTKSTPMGMLAMSSSGLSTPICGHARFPD